MLKHVIVVILLLLLLGAGYAFAVSNNLITTTILPNSITTVFDRLAFESTAIESPIASEQTKLLSERASEVGTQLQQVGGQVQQVLGTAVEVAPESADQAPHERALDYGRYLYCKQVVEQYEISNEK
jgi:hypothetical protein